MPTIVTGGKTPQQTLQEEKSTIAQSEKSNVRHNVDTESGTLNQDSEQHKAIPTIANNTVPVVVFVGPPTSGKSMILLRLAKYLRDCGYTIKTDPTFLNTTDYQKDCQEFNDKLNTNIALGGSVTFLLVNVYHNGREVAKLLEAPGEDFYTTDPAKIKAGKNRRIEPYLATIMASRNPKSYVVLLDLDSEISFRTDSYHRDSYTQRFLNYFYPAININRDRIVLLYNKIDATRFGTINSCIDIAGARADASIYYKPLFASMQRTILGGLFKSDNFVFKTFCTGMFCKQFDSVGKKYETYNIADDVYPRELWREITKKW